MYTASVRDSVSHALSCVGACILCKQVHGRGKGLELMATIPAGHKPEMSADDLAHESRPRVSLSDVLAAPHASECWAATAVGCVRGDEGGAVFDAAAVGVFVGGPRRDSPQPEVLPTFLPRSCGGAGHAFCSVIGQAFCKRQIHDNQRPHMCQAWQEPGETLHGHFLAHALRTAQVLDG